MDPARVFRSAVVESRATASSHRASTNVLRLGGNIVSFTFAHILGNVPSRCVLALALLLAPDGLVDCFTRLVNTWISFRKKINQKEEKNYAWCLFFA